MLTVLDEAYFEYVESEDYPDGIEESVKTGRRALVLRTFSKIYGLAGLRVGYGVGPAEVVEAIGKVRNAFDINQTAQDAARASLGNEAEIARRRRETAEERSRLEEACTGLGLTVASPPVANFVYVETGEDSRAVVRPAPSRGCDRAPPRALRRGRCDPRHGRAPARRTSSSRPRWSACSRARIPPSRTCRSLAALLRFGP